MPAAGDELVSAQALSAVHRLAAAARRDPVAARLLSEPETDAAALAAQAPAFSAALTRELALIGHRGPGEVEMRSCHLRRRSRPADPDGDQGADGAAARAAPPAPRCRCARGRWPSPRPARSASGRCAATAWCARSGCSGGCCGSRAAAWSTPVSSASVDDVFYLLVDELDAPPPDLAGIVARRRAEQATLQDLVPPEAFSGRWHPDRRPDRRAFHGGEVLHGIGVSGGQRPRAGPRRARRDDRRPAARRDPRRQGHRRRATRRRSPTRRPS